MWKKVEETLLTITGWKLEKPVMVDIYDHVYYSTIKWLGSTRVLKWIDGIY